MYIIMYKYSAFKIKYKPFSFRYTKVVLCHPGHFVMAEHLPSWPNTLLRHGRLDRPALSSPARSLSSPVLSRHARLSPVMPGSDRASHTTAGSSTISLEISVHSGLTFSTNWFFHSRLKCFICFSLAIACSMDGKTS